MGWWRGWWWGDLRLRGWLESSTDGDQDATFDRTCGCSLRDEALEIQVAANADT